jgi:hypothetical protein
VFESEGEKTWVGEGVSKSRGKMVYGIKAPFIFFLDVKWFLENNLHGFSITCTSRLHFDCLEMR